MANSKALYGIIISFLCCLLMPIQARALLTNGGFESGDYTGWNPYTTNPGLFAEYSVITNLGPITPTEGIYMAMVQGADFPDGSSTSISALWADPFDWTSYDEVCFDMKLLFDHLPGDLLNHAFEAVGNHTPEGQPVLAVIEINTPAETYKTINAITGEYVVSIPILSGGETGFNYMTEWERFCFNPDDITYPDWGPEEPISLWLFFGNLMHEDASEVAFLFDNLTGPLSPCIDLDGDGYGDPASETCTYPEQDCDDTDLSVNPGAVESKDAGNCDDGVDNDCDGLADADPECQGCFIGVVM